MGSYSPGEDMGLYMQPMGGLGIAHTAQEVDMGTIQGPSKACRSLCGRSLFLGRGVPSRPIPDSEKLSLPLGR